MNKQIDEMAKDIRIAETEYMVAMLTADIDDAIDGAAPRNERLAIALYEKGYRKSTDVARGIFEEIKDIRLREIHHCETIREKEHTNTGRAYWEGGANSLRQLTYKLAELKKKYESEEKE